MATTINAEKRLFWAGQPENQDRVFLFLLEKAVNVIQLATPDPEDFKLASYIMAGSMNKELAALILFNESALIGPKIDTDVTITDSNIHYVINDGNKFNVIADAFNTAGLLG